LSTNASCYAVGGLTAGLNKNAGNSIGIGLGGGAYQTITSNILFNLYFWR
jgi:hypothetical protein